MKKKGGMRPIREFGFKFIKDIPKGGTKMNYLEELSYWYFRFNGYFLIQNYVNHKNNDGLMNTHETDLLGIRFPNVIENIEDSTVDYDKNIISNSKIMCVMVESKSGNIVSGKIFKSRDVIKYNIQRFGIFAPNDITDNIIISLFENSYWENDNYKIIKVLVAEDEKQNEKYFFISKEEIIKDFHRRNNLYRKNQDRILFNSSLIQYLFS